MIARLQAKADEMGVTPRELAVLLADRALPPENLIFPELGIELVFEQLIPDLIKETP